MLVYFLFSEEFRDDDDPSADDVCILSSDFEKKTLCWCVVCLLFVMHTLFGGVAAF